MDGKVYTVYFFFSCSSSPFRPFLLAPLSATHHYGRRRVCRFRLLQANKPPKRNPLLTFNITLKSISKNSDPFLFIKLVPEANCFRPNADESDLPVTINRLPFVSETKITRCLRFFTVYGESEVVLGEVCKGQWEKGIAFQIGRNTRPASLDY